MLFAYKLNLFNILLVQISNFLSNRNVCLRLHGYLDLIELRMHLSVALVNMSALTFNRTNDQNLQLLEQIPSKTLA